MSTHMDENAVLARLDRAHLMSCSDPTDPQRRTLYSEAAAMIRSLRADDQGDEATLSRLGLEKRYLLCGHPAWPDPLAIWPPTEERAADYHRQYCTDSFEEYVINLGHTPRRLGGGPMTAEDYNPRILIVWEHVGKKLIYAPEGDK